MNVLYWPVNTTKSQVLKITQGDISRHLLTDWMPMRPSGVSAAVFGWPQEILESHPFNGSPQYTGWMMAAAAAGMERQWKGVVSWMLGVAGTRHVLEVEKYRWVAPLSAFYPNAVAGVHTPPGMPSSFAPGCITIDAATKGVKNNLRPDYIAIRPQNNTFDWAIVESKGTRDALSGRHACPAHWYKQAKNAVVTDVKSGQVLPTPRNIVVATRIEPNAKTPRGRRVQIRAWNSADPPARGLPAAAVTEVVGAHLFGLFKNLHMGEVAEAIAESVNSFGDKFSERSPRDPQSGERIRDVGLAVLADLEQTNGSRDQRVFRRYFTSEVGDVFADLETPLVDIAKDFIKARREDQFESAIRRADGQLDEIDSADRTKADERPRRTAGVTVQIPERRLRG